LPRRTHTAPMAHADGLGYNSAMQEFINAIEGFLAES
jgi:hypothetical protein